MRTALFALVWLAVLLARPVNVAACSCREASPSRLTMPSDGAAGFPTNGVVRVFVTAFPTALHDELAREYRLVDPRGTPVPLRTEWVGTRLDLHPAAPLQPRTRYTLERIFAYGADGALLGDTQRFATLRVATPTVRRAWFPEARFETGAGVASPRPAAAFTQLEGHAEVRLGGGDCGPGLSVSSTYALPAGVTATDLVQLEVRGQGLAPLRVRTSPAAGSTGLGANDLLCTPDPVSIPFRPPMQVRVSLVDAAGAVVATSPWTDAPGGPNLPLPRDWESQRRSHELPPELVAALRRGWAAPPIVSPVAVSSRGPEACPFGLETVSSRELSPTGGRASYEDRATLVVEGGASWLALAEGADQADSRLYSVAPDASSRALGTTLVGPVSTVASLDGGPLVVSVRYDTAGVAHPQLQAFTRDGALRWMTPLPVGGRQHEVAVGGDRALVVWQGDRDPLRPRLGWALYDTRRGTPVGRPRVNVHPIDADSSAVAAWVGDHFVLAWPAPRENGRGAPVQLATLTPGGVLGAPRALPMNSEGVPDLAVAGEHLGIVTAEEGVVRWALLDRDGAVVRAPVVLSDGVGDGAHRKPRITVRDGLFVVTWESTSIDAVWATVVDAHGTFAPALDVSGTRRASTGLVTALDATSFLGVYTVDYRRAWATVLRCRREAPFGAPPRIAPAAP